MTAPLSLFDKIWQRHAVITRPDGAVLLHVGRHLLHDGSRAGFRFLAEAPLPLHHARRTYGTPDHYVPTASHELAAISESYRRDMVTGLAENATKYGFAHFGLGDPRQGIIHVIGPEQGITLPGIVMVCGDSHTATHGALGALAFGIGALGSRRMCWRRRRCGSAQARQHAGQGRGQAGAGRRPPRT